MKLTKSQKLAIIDMINSEGWFIVKEFKNEFGNICMDDILKCPAEDRDKMSANANKLKFGVGGILWFIQNVEKVKDTLDKEE
jgi:uncharacterized protein YwqG